MRRHALCVPARRRDVVFGRSQDRTGSVPAGENFLIDSSIPKRHSKYSMLIEWTIRLVSFVAIGEQLLIGGGSLGLVFHRHGEGGLHAHLITGTDLWGGAAESARFGHQHIQDGTIGSGEVEFVGVLLRSVMNSPREVAEEDPTFARPLYAFPQAAPEPGEPLCINVCSGQLLRLIPSAGAGDDTLQSLVSTSHALRF